MAQNSLPKPLGSLQVLAGKSKGGLAELGVSLNITQITAASLQTDISALASKCGIFNAARAARTAAHKTLITASKDAKKFLSDARGILVAHWGETYTQDWAGAGWTNNSTAVPKTQPERLALVQALSGFLVSNGTFEVDAAPLVFTVAQANTVAGAFAAALDGVGHADTASDTARDARTVAESTLRRDLRALIGILNQKLTPNDPRWATFGLNAPGAATTPKAPAKLKSHLALPGQAHLTCSMPAGTDHLRWFKKGPGDADYVFVEDTADAELLLDGLTSGQVVEFYVTAVNPAGESVPSAILSVTIG